MPLTAEDVSLHLFVLSLCGPLIADAGCRVVNRSPWPRRPNPYLLAMGRSTLARAHQPHVSPLLLLCGAALRWCAFVVMARLHPLVVRRRASIRYVRLTFGVVPFGFAVSRFSVMLYSPSARSVSWAGVCREGVSSR